VIGGERPRQTRYRGLGGVVLQVAAACPPSQYLGPPNAAVCQILTGCFG
jgi:hypothetical protein